MTHSHPLLSLRGAASLALATSFVLVVALPSCGGSSASGANVCPEGPGQCTNGDSSTCRCGESCVQTATCDGCGYECVKGCATDADCEGYFSGDTPPEQLSCIGASSTMPVAHCGIAFDSTTTVSSTTGSGASSSGSSGAPCMAYASYDHYCTDQGYSPHFNQCINGEVPADGCQNVLLDGVSCGQGGAGGTIQDCYCCP